jgi:hypothetical protein
MTRCDMTDPEIDWTALARELGTISETEHGWNESGGHDVGQRAIVRMLGPHVAMSAVRAYVDGERGCELARSVLLVLRAPEAADDAWRIFRESTCDDERERAIELLRALADPRALPWYDEVVGTSHRRSERYWAADGVAELAAHARLDRATEDAWIERLARDDDWHVGTAGRRIRQLARREHEELASEPALRRVLEAAGWTLDPHGIAFLVARLVARAPEATDADLRAHLSTWQEADHTSVAQLAALSVALLATAREAK